MRSKRNTSRPLVSVNGEVDVEGRKGSDSLGTDKDTVMPQTAVAAQAGLMDYRGQEAGGHDRSQRRVLLRRRSLSEERAQRTRFGPAGRARSSPVGAVPARPVR